MTSEKNTTADDIVAITRAAYEAYIAKDREVVERLIARDFHFTSPLDNRIDRAAYFARCWPNSENITGFDFIQLVPHGDRVFIIYEGRRAHGHGFRNTEVEVYFGWSIPHEAPVGGFIDEKKAEKMH